MKYSFIEPKPTSPIIGKVCKHVIYVVNKYDKFEDRAYVKVTNVHEDGKRSQALAKIDNYRRSFYTVKPKYRKFKQQKDYIDKRMLDVHWSNEAKMPMIANRILNGYNDPNITLDQIKGSPYFFGAEHSVPVDIKSKMLEKYKELSEKEESTLASYDVETDMLNKYGGGIIMAATTMKKVIYFCALRQWYDGDDDETIITKLNEHAERLMGDTLRKRNATIYWELVDSPAEIVENNVMVWHQLKPDFVASWNAEFDMSENQKALLDGNRDLEEVYSHPGTDKAYRFYDFDKGKTHKRKENGDVQALPWQNRFPTLRGAATWQWLDYGSFYAIKNAPKGKKESYALQFTCEDNGVEGKLYTESASHLPLGKASWHVEMQKKHKYEYSIYCIRDNIAIEELAEKTNDIAINLPLLLKASELKDYPSQPTLSSNVFSMEAPSLGYVWGTKGRGKDELDKHKPALTKWIALLDPELITFKGKPLFIGMQDIFSRGRRLVNDIDVSTAYPMGTIAANVSNKTTKMEACQISGLGPLEFREVGVNYASSAKSNAVKLCKTLHGFPGFEDIEEYYQTLKAA